MQRSFAAAGLLVAAAFLVSSSGAAQTKPAAPAKQDACFFPRDILGFSAPDDHTVYLRVGPSDYYKLGLMGPCPNLDFALGIALRNYRGDVTICSPTDAEVVVRLSGAIPDHCPVQTIQKLSPQEVALLGKNKP